MNVWNVFNDIPVTFHKLLFYYRIFRFVREITKRNNYKRTEKKKKKIYVYSGIKKKKKKEGILNERINRINGNKKEENITMDKYEGNGTLPR